MRKFNTFLVALFGGAAIFAGSLMLPPVNGEAQMGGSCGFGPANPCYINGGGSTSTTNLTQVGGSTIALGQTTSANSLPVTIASDQTIAISGTVTASGTVSLGAGSATIGALTANQSVNVAQINGVTPLMGNGTSGTGAQRVTIASDSTGQIALASGSVAQLLTVPSKYHAVVPNNTTGVVVKNSAGSVCGVTMANNGASAGFLHMYDASSAPTAGSGTIVKLLIDPGSAASTGAGIVYTLSPCVTFGTGIAYTFTTGITDADTGTPAASTFSIDIDYR